MTFYQLVMLTALAAIAIGFGVAFWALWAALPLYRLNRLFRRKVNHVSNNP